MNANGDDPAAEEVMTALRRLCAVTDERCLTAAEADTVRRAIEFARGDGAASAD